MIIDLGTSSFKCGMVGESTPSAIIPAVVGIPTKKTKILLRKVQQQEEPLPDIVIGLDAVHNFHRVSLHYPLEHGIVKQWEQLEHLAQACFDELDQDPASTGVILTQPTYNPKSCIEKLAQVFFENFNCPTFAVVPSGVCALYSSGRTTGVVLDSGEGVTSVTPVYDGFIIEKAANRINVGGKEVTDHLKRLLFERGYNFSNPQDEMYLKQVKEELCYLSKNYSKDIAAQEEVVTFSLPDGQAIDVGKERFRAAEILFDSTITQSELPSLTEFVANCIKACPIDVRRMLLSSTVLSGGNTLFPNLGSRLEASIGQFFPGLFASTKVIESSDRLCSVWAGASIMASFSSFQQVTVTREVYDENGPSIVHGYRREETEAEE